MPLEQALHTLRSVFGYTSFRGPQQPIIEALCQGRDALVLMPTGGGKSLCYQLPALILDGVGVVISPLIALMEDQVSALHQLGVKAAFLNSTLDIGEIRNIEQQLLDGCCDLLYIAPERLSNPRTLALLSRCKIALFAIDEAHCVSQWGHDFRADYLQLSILHQQFPNVPRIALTATADERTRQEIIQRLALEQAQVFISSFDRPNIRYRIVLKQNPRQQLLSFIRAEHRSDTGIVYCLSRKKVEDTAEWLNQQGLRALPYHAGLSHDVRRRNQHQFLMEDGLIIVATIAFGMGIDKPNVRFVAHLDLPKSIEAYYQETGRAGRDGLAANAWMVYGLQDVLTLREMLSASNADATHKRVELHKLEAMLALCEMVNCRRQALLDYFGEALSQPCGNCDACLEPADTWDGSVAAQQALSAIYRTGQRFGVSYLIDVLLGRSSDPRIKQFGHDQQSTFGIGKQLDEKQWRSVFRQLVAKSLVEVDFSGFGGLKLTDACRAVLRGEQTLMLRKDSLTAKNKAESSAHNQPDNALWQALRTKRREIADRQDVPPYVIFHDATLMAMVEARPKNRRELGMISGVGERKLEAYGAEFLAVLSEFAPGEASPVGDTHQETLDLFQLGYSVAKIAASRNLKEDTIYNHLVKYLETGTLPLTEVVNLPADELASISQAIKNLTDQQKPALKPVFEHFNGAYSYGLLRCVRAGLMWQT